MKALTICQPYPFLICLPETDPRVDTAPNQAKLRRESTA
jgi:hypothetical protein